MADLISTFSGQRINLQAENIEDLIVEIKFSDIAIGLSRIARFNGQTTEFYSVAQHSVIVSSLVPERLKLAALLHDAAEMATGDIVSPLKALFPAFKEIENRVEAAIFAKFGVSMNHRDHKIVKSADLVALATEKRDLMPRTIEDWEIIAGVKAMKEEIVPLPPKEAHELFLNAWLDLGMKLD